MIFELDMHYVGQTHTVARAAAGHAGRTTTTGIDAEIIRAAFETAYRRQFSRLLPGIPVRIVTLRTAAIGRRPHFDLAALAPAAGRHRSRRRRRGTRQVWFDGAWHETSIWSRLDLPVGAVIAGPAMLEQPDATIVVEPGLVGAGRPARQPHHRKAAVMSGDPIPIAHRLAARRPAERLPASGRRLCARRAGRGRDRGACRHG